MSHFKSIYILSVLGAREWIRLKFFHLVVFVSLLFIGFSYLLSSLTFSVQERLLFDFGLSGLELGLVFISSLIGSHAIQREIDRKTLLVLLVRPLPRWHIVIGAWGALVFLNLLFLSGFSFTLIATSGAWKLLDGFLLCTIASFLKSLVIASFALAMGLLVRPILAMGASISYWIVCYSLPDVKYFVKKMNDVFLTQIVDFVDYCVPQFYRFNWKSYYNVLNQPTGVEISWMTLHCFAWIFFWLFCAALFFRRKEIV